MRDDSPPISIEDLLPNYREVAEVIGIEAALKLSKAFGGTSVYIPSCDRGICISARNKRIVEEFDGANARELAKRYHLSLVWIMGILERSRQKERRCQK